MNRNSDKSDSRVFYRNVFALVVPMALQNLINVAVTSADVMMRGQTGETVLSASSLAGQVQFIMTLFFFGLTSGAAILTAQYWGKGDTRTIEKVMGIALRFSLCTGLVFALAAFLIPAQLMRIFTPEEDVIAEGVKYLRIIAVSYVPMALTNIYLNIMRSVERVVVSTVTYLACDKRRPQRCVYLRTARLPRNGNTGCGARDGLRPSCGARHCARLLQKDQPHGAPERPRYLCA